MRSRQKSQSRRTPVRAILKPESVLQPSVRDGLAALKEVDRGYIDRPLRTSFADSLDLDSALRPGHEHENRWDYLLGHDESGKVIALEPHSARTDEVSTVIAKRKAAVEQLRDHLGPGARIAHWLWVSSGRVQFANTERARYRLDQNGISFVGRTVMAKHLPIPDDSRIH